MVRKKIERKKCYSLTNEFHLQGFILQKSLDTHVKVSVEEYL